MLENREKAAPNWEQHCFGFKAKSRGDGMEGREVSRLASLGFSKFGEK